MGLFLYPGDKGVGGEASNDQSENSSLSISHLRTWELSLQRAQGSPQNHKVTTYPGFVDTEGVMFLSEFQAIGDILGSRH